MKARSVVFTHAQKPFTIFGLPALLVMLSGVASMVLAILVAVIAGMPFGVLAMVLSMVICLGLCFRIAATDPHVESMFLQCLAFWRAVRERYLVVG